MSKCINNVELQGFINYPSYKEESKYFGASICISTSYKNRQTNEDMKKQTFISICSFRDVAKEMSSLQKGCFVKVTGKIDVSRYEENGVKKVSTKVIVDKFELLEAARPQQPSADTQPQPVQQTSTSQDSEDCPF